MPTRISATVFVTLTLFLAATTARSALLVIVTPDGSTSGALSAGPVAGAGYSASADLATGVFTAGTTGTLNSSPQVTVRIPFGGGSAVRFFNDSGADIELGIGDIGARLFGSHSQSSFSARPGAGGTSGSTVQGELNVSVGGTTYVLRAVHEVSQNYDANDVPVGSNNGFIPTTTNGGTIVPRSLELDELDVILNMPALVIPDGGFLDLYASLIQTSFSTTGDAASTTRFEIRFPSLSTLPLDDDSGTTLDWTGTPLPLPVPTVAARWVVVLTLLLIATGVLAMARRQGPSSAEQ